jgi:hypothetical protein
MASDIVSLGAASISKAGVITWQAKVPVGNDNDDAEPFGEPDVFQSLGVDSVPFPATDDGRAEGVILRDCGGKDAVCIGARDTRNNAFIGKMRPGDTTVHATGPKATAQCFLKNEKKQAGLAVDDVSGKTMMFLLDGKNKQSKWMARGAVVQLEEDGAVSVTEKGGASLILRDGKIFVMGDLVLPGMKPGMVLMQGPPSGSPGGAASVPLLPVTGISC